MSATLMRGVLDQIQTQAQQASGPSNQRHTSRSDVPPFQTFYLTALTI